MKKTRRRDARRTRRIMLKQPIRAPTKPENRDMIAYAAALEILG
jgi:hypothetical protein